VTTPVEHHILDSFVIKTKVEECMVIKGAAYIPVAQFFAIRRTERIYLSEQLPVKFPPPK
jgi:hypothetical protein